MSVTLPSPAPAPAAPGTRWEPFRHLLTDQRADCLRQRELALSEAATAVPDPVAVRRAATLQRTVEEIDAALQRIADGSYGVCTDCHGDISSERLEFRPHAATCVACPQPAS
ncbi:TraR/DksA family transcriptional regulator [Geodermatophilus sp. FMUSA9-8]|uniref:TraR/DksA family transcriptional regulator n=1 Tax=Geodermatophilus sp. FMUSA9-8 TaxID=3120155 RepID=UPI00300801E9